MYEEQERINANIRAIGELESRLATLERALQGGLSAMTPTISAPPFTLTIAGAAPSPALALSTAFDDNWIPIEYCDNFYENTTSVPREVTVSIKNDSEVIDMTVDIDGSKVAEIPKGKAKTIIVTIPAGKSLHVNAPGKYLPPTTAH